MNEEPYFEWARGGKLRYVEPSSNRFKYLSPKNGQRFLTLEGILEFIQTEFTHAYWTQSEDVYESYGPRDIHS